MLFDAPFFIVWAIISFIVAGLDTDREIGYWPAFVVCILCSPVVGALYIFASKRKSDILYEKEVLQLLKEVNERKKTE